MGTNYYFHSSGCKLCGHIKEKLHIGKSSGGWCFSLRVHPDRGINSLDDWILMWLGSDWKIIDEYGDELTSDRMLDLIKDRSWVRNTHTQEFYDRNHAEPGPNDLLRHRVDGVHCVGHGVGTWDYIGQDFC
jgi:hypothetical protein